MIGANFGRFGEADADGSCEDWRGSSKRRLGTEPAFTAAQPDAGASLGTMGGRPIANGGATKGAAAPTVAGSALCLHPGSELGGGRGSPGLNPPSEDIGSVADESIEGCRTSEGVYCAERVSTGDMLADVRMDGRV
jgi:hypothetical protein